MILIICGTKIKHYKKNNSSFINQTLQILLKNNTTWKWRCDVAAGEWQHWAEKKETRCFSFTAHTHDDNNSYNSNSNYNISQGIPPGRGSAFQNFSPLILTNSILAPGGKQIAMLSV